MIKQPYSPRQKAITIRVRDESFEFFKNLCVDIGYSQAKALDYLFMWMSMNKREALRILKDFGQAELTALNSTSAIKNQLRKADAINTSKD